MNAEHKGRVMVVDINSNDADLVERAHQMDTQQFQTAPDVQSALAQVESEFADCVILVSTSVDDRLWDAVSRLRRSAPQLKILVVTSISAIEPIERLVGDRVDGCIACEQLTPEALQALINEVVVRHDRQPITHQRLGSWSGQPSEGVEPLRPLLHDLRGSIGVILLHLSTLRANRSCQNPDVQESLAVIHEMSREMTDVIERIRSETRLRSGQQAD